MMTGAEFPASRAVPGLDLICFRWSRTKVYHDDVMVWQGQDPLIRVYRRI